MNRYSLLVVLALAAACTFDGQVGDQDEREDAGSLTPDGGEVTTPDGGDVTSPDGGDVTTPDGGDVTPDAGTVEGCGSVTAAGECDDNDAIRCEDGEIARMHCAGSEIGGTGCTSGACVGVAAGRACDALRHCSAGLACTNAICTAPTPATLQITVTGQGTVTSTPPAISCPGTCATTGVQGDQVSLTATATAGWAFQSWGGACSGTAATIPVTLSGAKTCTATFTQTSPTLRELAVTVTPGGTVASAPTGIACPGDCSESYAAGTSVTLTATASANHRFKAWETCSVATTPSISVTLTNAVTCRAVFEESVPVPGTATVAWRHMGPGRTPQYYASWGGKIVWNAAGTRFATFGARDFRYFDAAAGNMLGASTEVTTTDSNDFVSALAWNPSGTVIAAAVKIGQSLRVHLRNLATNAVVTINAVSHTDPIYGVAWSPDGTLVATGSYDGSIALWNATTGAAVRSWNNPAGGTYSTLKWSPDGARIAALGQNGLAIWSTAATYPREHLFTVAGMRGDLDWSNDSTRVTASNGYDSITNIYVWNAVDGTIEKTWSASEQFDPSFDPSGTRLVTRFAGDVRTNGDVRIWDIATASVIRTIPFAPNVRVLDVEWSPTAPTIAVSGSDGSVRLVDSGTGGVVRSFNGPKSEVRALAFNPARNELYGASGDGLVYALAASNGAYVRDIGDTRFSERVTSLAVSPPGTELAGAVGSDVYVWNSANGTPSRNWYADFPGELGWSSTNVIATGIYHDTRIKLWPAAGTTATTTLVGQYAATLDWHPGGALLASAGGQTVQLWDAEAGISRTTLNCPSNGNAYSGVWRPDGVRLAGGCSTGITLWSSATGTWGAGETITATPITTATAKHLTWHPDGLVLAGVTTNGIQLWDAWTGNALLTTPIVSDGTVNAVTWSDDGALLYVGTAAGTITAYSIAP